MRLTPSFQRSKRAHPWHASYAVLATMTTLLVLNGCDNKKPSTEEPAAQLEKNDANKDSTPQVSPAPSPAQETEQQTGGEPLPKP